MNEFDHFKKFILCNGDMVAVVHYFYIKRIHLVNFSYIVTEDYLLSTLHYVLPKNKKNQIDTLILYALLRTFLSKVSSFLFTCYR
jgi:uncharacterized BrkB/YihY/UPF0761 family membrane protein